jgi:hypothetical protein
MATSQITTPATRFHNLSPSMLADIIGELDRKAKDAETELKAAKEALKARGVVSATGARFTVQLKSSIRQSLDIDRVKAAMGQVWFDDHSKLAEVVTVRIAAVKAPALAA